MDLAKMIDNLATCSDNTITFYDHEDKVVVKNYASVHSDVTDAVSRLRGWGVKGGMRIGLLATNSYEYVVYDLALIHLDCISVSLPEEFAARPTDELIERYELNLLLLSKKDVWPSLSIGRSVAYFDSDDLKAPRLRNNVVSIEQPTGDRALSLTFSSGTSGKIKCLIVGRRGTESTVSSFVKPFSLRRDDSLIVFLPLSAFQQRMMLYSAFYYRFNLILVKPSQLFTAFKELKPTLCLAPPLLYETIHNQFTNAVRDLAPQRRLMLKLLSSLARYVPASSARGKLLGICYGRVYASLGGRLRIMWTGMAPIKRATLDLFESMQIPLYEAYGLTEVGGICANTPAHKRLGSVGRPLVEGSVKLAEDGEIIVSKDHLLTFGYLYADPEEVKSTFLTPNTIATGDVGRFDRDGFLYIVGRKKEIIITSQGIKVHPEKIESAINRSPHVDRSVVFGASLPYLVALISLQGPRTPDIESQIEQHIRRINSELSPAERVVKYHLTTEQFTRENGLLTRNLKLDRRAILKRFESELLQREASPEQQKADSVGEGPRTELEKTIAEVWAEVLHLEKVGRAENFFDLGGDSLIATQVVSRMRDVLQINLPLRVFFESPTVEALGAWVEAALKSDQTFAAAPIVPVSRDNPLPLSFAQQRLWFIDQFDPGSYAYNMPGAIKLEGALDVDVLERSFAEIHRRHGTLRTSFDVFEGDPIQVISPDAPFKLQLLDMSALPEADRPAFIRETGLSEAKRPFDLRESPLLRTKLIRLGAREHILFITMHHIISDGWSIAIFLRELASLYAAFSAGKPSPLPELTIQYADFAQWQRQWLQGEVLDRLLSYWKKQLGGELPVLQLPTDKARPATPSLDGAKQTVSFSPGLTERLKMLSRREGVTLFMTLTAAFNTLLYRYSGQKDIILGTPIANRNRAETEDLIGFFVNTLVLRTDLSAEPSFLELLGRVREGAMEAYANQDLPFERLVEELQPERDQSRHPLFQAMIALQTESMSEFEVAGLTMTPVEVGEVTTKFIDLVLDVVDKGDELAVSLEYSTDLFEGDTIRRMLGHFETLAEGVAEDPARKIIWLPLLTDAERRQMLVEWNDTRVDYPLHMCVHQLFEASVEKYPDAVAVVYAGEEVSYSELNRLSNQLAHHLRGLGVGPEVLVGLCLERSVELIVGMLGVLKAGGAYVAIDPEYPTDRIASMLEDARVPVLLTQERLLSHMPVYDCATVCIDRDWVEIGQQSTANPDSGVCADNLAIVLYTSGSTGKPKGVMMFHGATSNHIFWVQHYFPLTPEDSMPVKYSVCFDASAFEIFYPLHAGARLVIVPQGMQQDLAYFVNLVVEHKITTMDVPTPQLQVLLEDEKFIRCHWLKRITCASDSLMVEVKERYFELLGKELVHFYGPCEASIGSTFNVCRPGGEEHIASVGKPVSNTEIYILDPHLQPLPVGVSGEIYIGGVGVTRGYLYRPDVTAEKFIPDPFSASPGARLYKTGDRGRYRPDGNLEFGGRIDYQVKIRGYRIELGDIEAALTSHPLVKEAVVLARASENGRARDSRTPAGKSSAAAKRLVAYIVSEGGEPPTLPELSIFLQKRLPEYMVPTAYVMMDSFPLTTNGKIDRNGLPAPTSSALDLESDFVAPRNAVEEALSMIWAEVLGVESVSVHANFFELGGHSLAAASVMYRVRDIFNVELPVRTLFEGPTLAHLSQALISNEAKPGLTEKIARAYKRVKSMTQEELLGALKERSAPRE
jgi:amino acid adenylation domain-containing protein